MVTTTKLTSEDFCRWLPDGWRVEMTTERLSNDRTGHVITAIHPLYGRVNIGPKLRVVPMDMRKLADRVQDAVAPPLTYSQWQAAGIRQGYLRSEEDGPLPRALRLLAVCIERGDVVASDVAQALFRADAYTLGCPVAEASGAGDDVAELFALLGQAAEAYGYRLPGSDDAPFKECGDVAVPNTTAASPTVKIEVE